eukprot:3174107-Pleurochrysis_carterae.AAC.1
MQKQKGTSSQTKWKGQHIKAALQLVRCGVSLHYLSPRTIDLSHKHYPYLSVREESLVLEHDNLQKNSDRLSLPHATVVRHFESIITPIVGRLESCKLLNLTEASIQLYLVELLHFRVGVCRPCADTNSSCSSDTKHTSPTNLICDWLQLAATRSGLWLPCTHPSATTSAARTAWVVDAVMRELLLQRSTPGPPEVGLCRCAKAVMPGDMSNLLHACRCTSVSLTTLLLFPVN